MRGLGKPRSPAGKFLDNHEKSQTWLVNKAGISKDTATRVCSDPAYYPSPTVMKKILGVFRTLNPDIKQEEIWPM